MRKLYKSLTQSLEYQISIEVEKLATKSGKAIITKLQRIFSTHGIPEIMFCNNSPYGSAEM